MCGEAAWRESEEQLPLGERCVRIYTRLAGVEVACSTPDQIENDWNVAAAFSCQLRVKRQASSLQAGAIIEPKGSVPPFY